VSGKLAAHTENIPIKMRTKTLLLTAFVGALGFTAAQAQVYSVNAVGYVNKSIPAGFSIVANPLNNGENKVADVFGANPGALTVYRFGDAGFAINSYDTDFEEWTNGDEVINPGEGFFVLNDGDAVNITFVGEVPQGDLSNALPQGFSIRSSQVPQSGKLDADLGFPTDEAVTVYQYGAAGYAIASWDTDFEEWSGTADGAGPVIGVAEGFWVLRESATNWTRSFSTGE
jgi:hypothetical protein